MFLAFDEKEWLKDYHIEFKPVCYGHCVNDIFVFFHYKQVDGVAIGSPLRSALAMYF